MSRFTQKKDIARAVDILRDGGIIAYPTETVYGLGCDPYNKEACARIQEVKDRSTDKPMLLLAYSLEQVETMTGILNGIARKLAERFWPGPLTLIIRPEKDVPQYLLGPSRGIAFRVTPSPEAALLAELLGKPVISTSANRSGQSPAVTFEQVREIFADTVDFILGTPERLHGVSSTVADTTSGSLSIVREGCISLDELHEVIGND